MTPDLLKTGGNLTPHDIPRILREHLFFPTADGNPPNSQAAGPLSRRALKREENSGSVPCLGYRGEGVC